jgi:hypothetical protein
MDTETVVDDLLYDARELLLEATAVPDETDRARRVWLLDRALLKLNGARAMMIPEVSRG